MLWQSFGLQAVLNSSCEERKGRGIENPCLRKAVQRLQKCAKCAICSSSQILFCNTLKHFYLLSLLLPVFSVEVLLTKVPKFCFSCARSLSEVLGLVAVFYSHDSICSCAPVGDFLLQCICKSLHMFLEQIPFKHSSN